MNNKNGKQSMISISLIKKILEKLKQKDIKNKNEINIDIINTIEKFDIFINKRLKQINLKLKKYNKYIHIFSDIIIKNNINNNEEIILKSKAISLFSICILKNNINKENHKEIKKYLKILFFLLSIGFLLVKDLMFSLEVILNCLIEIIIIENESNYKIFDNNNEPLLFINDIIEVFINFPNLIKNNNFIENLISIFNKFVDNIKKLNILINEDNMWLKLLENKSKEDSLEYLEDKSYLKSIEKIKEFIINVYQKNMPKNIFDEIYNKSCIDLLFYINSITLIKELIKTEQKKTKKIGIDKGVYLLKNEYINSNINFNSNEFSLILTFNLIKKKKKKTRI